MSKAKKAAKPAPSAHEGKGFLALAGEAFAVLGEEIIEGKDKVVEVTAAKITAVKKAIKKITHKKTARPSKSAKKTPAKKVAKKVAVAAKKVKPASKKSGSAPKKAPKKKSSSRTK
jgi:hypothetical protein